MNDGTNSIGTNIYMELKKKIVTNEIMQGTLLYESEICEQFKASRTPVREAFRLLKSEGLVNIIQRKGVQVTQISHKNLADAFETRLWIECSAVRKIAAIISDSQLEYLRNILKNTPQNPVFHEEVEIFAKQNLLFHNCLVHSADNELANHFYERINMDIQRAAYFVQPFRYEKSWSEHNYILECLELRDANKAEEVVRQHIEKARDRLLL